MRIVDCTHAEHADAILEILNEAILHSTALYDYVPRPRESMRGWFDAKETGGFPVIGAVEGDDTEGTPAAARASATAAETSAAGGDTSGRLLLQRIIAAARAQQRHLLVGGIDLQNRASIALHESLGFVHAGTIRQAGFKFGRWLDLAFYELLLDTPERPVDG